MVGLVVVSALFVLAFVWWVRDVRSPSAREGRAVLVEERALVRERSRLPLSMVGAQAGGGLACPKCGGQSFRAHRRLSTKLTFGVVSLLGNARRVRCVTCGTDYARG